MPGRGQGKGKARVARQAPQSETDAGPGPVQGWEQGKSGLSPGHLKREGGVRSARDYAPGHGGQAPGQVGRDRGDRPVGTPEDDLIRRDG